MRESGPSRASKRIQAVVEKGPNYIFHLMAVSRAGFVSPYAETYRFSVEPEDLKLLESWRERLVTADGHSADLAPAGVFLPAFLGLRSAAGFAEYSRLLAQALSGRPEPFLSRYSAALARTADWIETVNRDWLAAHIGRRDDLRRLGDIYERNLPAYESSVWPLERPGMEEVAARLNAHFGTGPGQDTIARWEGLTGLTFKARVYRILLVRAIENGPNANSLGYDRNVFFSGSDPEWMIRFISHETGAHLLIEVFKAALAEAGWGGSGRDYDLSYRAFENLVRFYNTLILGTADIYPMPPHYEGDRFYQIYRGIHEREPGLSAGELLERGLERYARSAG